MDGDRVAGFDGVPGAARGYGILGLHPISQLQARSPSGAGNLGARGSFLATSWVFEFLVSRFQFLERDGTEIQNGQRGSCLYQRVRFLNVIRARICAEGMLGGGLGFSVSKIREVPGITGPVSGGFLDA